MGGCPGNERSVAWARSKVEPVGNRRGSSASATSPPESRADPYREAVLRELERWSAPVLTDEEIEIYAKVFLMKRGHELVPFFLWIDDIARIALRHDRLKFSKKS